MIDSVRSLITTGTPAGDSTADEKADSWPGAATAAAFAEAVESGRLNLPLPGGGRTRGRWAVPAELAGKTFPWPGWPKGTPTPWPSWPNSVSWPADPGRRRRLAGHPPAGGS